MLYYNDAGDICDALDSAISYDKYFEKWFKSNKISILGSENKPWNFWYCTNSKADLRLKEDKIYDILSKYEDQRAFKVRLALIGGNLNIDDCKISIPNKKDINISIKYPDVDCLLKNLGYNQKVLTQCEYFDLERTEIYEKGDILVGVRATGREHAHSVYFILGAKRAQIDVEFRKTSATEVYVTFKASNGYISSKSCRCYFMTDIEILTWVDSVLTGRFKPLFLDCIREVDTPYICMQYLTYNGTDLKIDNKIYDLNKQSKDKNIQKYIKYCRYTKDAISAMMRRKQEDYF